jgi:chromosome segregation ATPase
MTDANFHIDLGAQVEEYIRKIKVLEAENHRIKSLYDGVDASANMWQTRAMSLERQVATLEAENATLREGLRQAKSHLDDCNSGYHFQASKAEQLEAANAALRKRLEALEKAGWEAAGWLPWHEPTHRRYEGAKSDAGRNLRQALTADDAAEKEAGQ